MSAERATSCEERSLRPSRTMAGIPGAPLDRQSGLRSWSPADAKYPDGFGNIRRRYLAWRIHSMGPITAEKNKISC